MLSARRSNLEQTSNPTGTTDQIVFRLMFVGAFREWVLIFRAKRTAVLTIF